MIEGFYSIVSVTGLTRFNSGYVDTRPFHPASIPSSFLHKEIISFLQTSHFLKETLFSDQLSTLKVCLQKRNTRITILNKLL
jgi:hypothetical protein